MIKKKMESPVEKLVGNTNIEQTEIIFFLNHMKRGINHSYDKWKLEEY